MLVSKLFNIIKLNIFVININQIDNSNFFENF